MTRRIELGDFPVNFAASLTVRSVGIVGEGSGKAQPTIEREVGKRFQRRSMSRVKKSRRQVCDHCHDDSDWLPDCCQNRGLVGFRKGSDELPKRLQKRADLKPFREDSKDHSMRGSESGFRVIS